METWNYERRHCCCFTGHRPEKLEISEAEIKLLLKQEIENAVSDGFSVFISGMAPGVDIWAAQIVADMAKSNGNIFLVCTPPFEGFENQRTPNEREIYLELLKSACYVKYVCKHYSKSCFMIRNCFMVDSSARVIAAYRGVRGGTKNTVNYAKKNNIEVINILDNRRLFY